MKNKKSQPTKPDEIYQAGFIQIARYGQMVVLKNLLSDEGYKEFIKRTANSYPEIVEEINSCVLKIKNIVVKIDPLELLGYSFSKYALSTIDLKSEAELKTDDVINMRMIDYIQSVIASAPSLNSKYKKLKEDDWNLLFNEVKSIYSKINLDYSIARTADLLLDDKNYDHEWDNVYTEAQMLWVNVRGNRYSKHNIVHISELLDPHEIIFKEIFQFSVQDFVEGLNRIQNTFSNGIHSAFGELKVFKQKTLEEISNLPQNDLDTLTPPEQMQKIISENNWVKWQEDVLGKCFGYDLFNISRITSFPSSFLRELSWEPGEENSFFEEGNFKGWPLRLQPIKIRPFLWIKEECYSFDILNLMDNIYRIIQRKITQNKPSYINEWNKKQKIVSESLPVKLFKKLLPGCTILESVYYHWFPKISSNKKEWCESDILVIYDDFLIIVEVKAGSFTYTPPSTDFPSYIESIKNLLQKPALQGKRFLDYIESEDTVNLYDNEHKVVSKIQKSDHRVSTICCITLDNFTTISAKAESLKSINIDVGVHPVWALSVDDLRVYCDIFTSPLIFLHFLEERQRAFSSEKFSADDEIDHLGLYLKYNRYVSLAEELFIDTPVIWDSMRMDIDNYYHQLLVDPESAKVPEQEIPLLFQNILSKIENKNISKKSHFISVLLDLDGDTRSEIETKIKELLHKQPKRNKLIPLNLMHPAPFTIFCNQPNVPDESLEWMQDYTTAFLIRTENQYRILIQLYFDSNFNLSDVDFKFIYIEDIPNERLQEIKKISAEQAARFVDNYMKTKNLKKIKVNEPCPCGSGKKYKKCCGKL
jgi:hypothetical protein